MKFKSGIFIIGFFLLAGIGYAQDLGVGPVSFAEAYPCFHQHLPVNLNDLYEKGGNLLIKNQKIDELDEFELKESTAFLIKHDNKEAIKTIEDWYQGLLDEQGQKAFSAIEMHKKIIDQFNLRQISTSISDKNFTYGLTKKEFINLISSGKYCLISDFNGHLTKLNAPFSFPLDFNEIEGLEDSADLLIVQEVMKSNETTFNNKASRKMWEFLTPFKTSNPFTQQFLFHSLQDDPSSLYFTNSDNIVDVIIDSSEYINILKGEINKLDPSDNVFSTELYGEDAPNFVNDALSKAIAGTKTILIEGSKSDDGSWVVFAKITDRYDFEFKWYSYSSFISSIANNIAAFDQWKGAIRPYWVNIEFTHIFYFDNNEGND